MVARLLDELSPLEQLGLVDMSYSRIDTLDRCEAQFYYSYIAKLDRDFSGEHALLGNVLHSTLEEQLENDKELKLEEVLAEFRTQLDNWDESSTISDDLVTAGHTMLTDYVDTYSTDFVETKKRRILSKEKEFKIVIGRAFVRGFIDRVDIDEQNKVVYVVDYKSGKNEVSFKAAPKNLQLGIYAAAMQREFPDYQVHAELHYLRTDRHKGHLFSAEDFERVEEEISRITEEIIAKNNFMYTPNTRLCQWCDFQKQGTCPKGVKRVQGYYSQ